MVTAFLLAASLAQAAPVAPHYVSQRANQAYLREGPGYAYRVLWIYRHKGTPFRESANYDIWRRVTAPDGAVGWMSMEMLFRQPHGAGDRKGPDADPQGRVTGCENGGSGRSRRGAEIESLCRGSVPRRQRRRGWLDSEKPDWGVDANETFK